MHSAINGCYIAVLLSLISAGASCDLVKLLRLDNQHDALLGGGECVRAFVLCMFYSIQCVRVCVCVLSMLGIQSKGITCIYIAEYA